MSDQEIINKSPASSGQSSRPNAPGPYGTSSAGGQHTATRGEWEGVYDKAASAVSHVARSASEIGEEAFDVGSSYYRKAGRAISNIPSTRIMPLLMAGAVGYFMGWLIHGQSGRANTTSRYQRSLAYDRDREDRY